MNTKCTAFALSYLVFLVCTEQTRMMSLLHDDERDARLIAHLKLHTRFTDGAQLLRQHLQYTTHTD